ncbi:MAG: hypothetical protein KF869_10135 [Phycisphaeraceae bacterium]|nr:hypothetical protein [Phycisphaeraceae bacterium]
MEGEASANGSASGSGSGLLCVLLHPQEVAVPADLLASLSKRIRRVSAMSDSYIAFAEVCATARERRMFAKTPVVLVLVEPMQLPDAAQVVEAARRHAPNAALWWYSSAVNPRLRAVADGDTGAWAAARRRVSNQDTLVTGLAVGGSTRRPVFGANETPRVVVRNSGSGQRLRLVGHEHESRGPAGTRSPGPSATKGGEDPGHRTMTPLLSEEEMRMLLAERKSKPAGGPGQNRSDR